jgi:MSHA biogenesis protein MshQ
MVRKIILIWMLFYVNFVWSAGLQYLIRSTPTATSLDTHTGAATTWSNPPDDGSLLINIGFSFPFNGTTYTQVRISTNGKLNFGVAENSGGNIVLPNGLIGDYQSIYPYWDNLDPNAILALGGNGTIKYETLGSGDTQRLVVTFTDVPKCALYVLGLCVTSGGNFSFQTVLYKNGDIRFRYPSGGNSANGSSATIGVQENFSPSHYDQYSYNTTSIDFTKDILYSYLPSLSVSKTSCVIYDPVNSTTNPKRIPGSTIRYAIQISNSAYGTASNVFAIDTVDSGKLDTSTIKYLQIQNGACDCTGVTSANNNGTGGSADGVNPVILDYGSITGVVGGVPVQKCGYFEVDIK